MTRVTLKKLNAYLQVRAPRLELVKGKGYFYFADLATFNQKQQDAGITLIRLPESIYIYALNHLSLERWQEALDTAVEEYLVINRTNWSALDALPNN